MAYKFVGKSVPRLEGAEKVSGKTRYAAESIFRTRFGRSFCVAPCHTRASSRSTLRRQRSCRESGR